VIKRAVIVGAFLPIHHNERKGISCIKMHATRIQNVIKPTSRATLLHEQGEITQTVACNLLHEKDGMKQTICLNARSLLGHFYHPYTQFNGKVFRASRCTLRESKTQFNQRSVQLVARIRQNHPDNVRKSAVEK